MATTIKKNGPGELAPSAFTGNLYHGNSAGKPYVDPTAGAISEIHQKLDALTQDVNKLTQELNIIKNALIGE